MKRLNKYLLFVVVFLFFSQLSLAEKRIARITENFGRTNIYGGQGINYYIVGSINSEDLFYCETSKNEWYKITALKWTEKGEQIEGYVSKELVEFIDELPEQNKRELLLVTFEKQIEMSYKLLKSDTLSRKSAMLAMDKHCRTRYLPVVSIFPEYFCRTRDSVALSFFMESMLADNGSTSNMTYSFLTDCYLCNSDLLLQQLNVISRKSQRQLIIDTLVRGLKCHFKIQDIFFEKPEAQTKKNIVEFNRLVKKLEVVSQ